MPDSDLEEQMEFFGCLEDMRFGPENHVGFPAVKARLWPKILESAKEYVKEHEEEDDRDDYHERINSLHSMATAREIGGAKAVKVFRQLNEDMLRSEMSAALNALMPGEVNHMWSKKDFSGLVSCFATVFYSMHVSESRLVRKMPLLYLATLLQVMQNEPASLSSGWWKNNDVCHKKLGVLIRNVCAEGFRTGEKKYITRFAKVMMSGLALIKDYYGKEFSFRDMVPILKMLERADPNKRLVDIEFVDGVLEHLEDVHPNFHSELSYSLKLHKLIAGLGNNWRKKPKLKEYALNEDATIFVACLLPFAKDMAYMLQEIGNMFNIIRVNGYFQHVAKLFEKADKQESEKNGFSTAQGRTVLLAVHLIFTDLIQDECNTETCVKALLERLPPNGGYGKPPKRKSKRGRKRNCTPSPTPSELEQINEGVFGSDEDVEEGVED